MVYPLTFQPIYKDYLWGGRNLAKLGKQLPEGIVAESWEVSGHPDGVSLIANGTYAGMKLTDYIAQHSEEVLGSAVVQKYGPKLPLLVKIIDANQQLSVQVHPDQAYASLHESSNGKHEFWYVISAVPGAQIVYGLKPEISKSDFKQAIENGQVQSCLHYIPVKPGNSFYIPAGLVHATGAGIVLAEIQQSSNVTYRLYDFDRKDASGNLRPLHIEKALKVIDFDRLNSLPNHPEVIYSSETAQRTRLVAAPYFSVELIRLHGRMSETVDGSKFSIITVLEGAGEIIYQGGKININVAETVLIPATLGNYTIQGTMRWLKAVPD